MYLTAMDADEYRERYEYDLWKYIAKGPHQNHEPTLLRDSKEITGLDSNFPQQQCRRTKTYSKFFVYYLV